MTTEYGYRHVIRKELYDNSDALTWHERDARHRLVDMVEDDVWMHLRPRVDEPMKWVPWGDPDDPDTHGLVPCPLENADHIWMKWTLVTRPEWDDLR